MKLGVFSVLFSDKPLREALYAIVKLGLEAAEPKGDFWGSEPAGLA